MANPIEQFIVRPLVNINLGGVDDEDAIDVDAILDAIPGIVGGPSKGGLSWSTIKGFKGLCDGDYDHLPESAFYMVGTIEEAVAKAEQLAAEAA